MDRFNINLFLAPTSPSLAFRLFRTKYLKEDTVPILEGNSYEYIKQAYYGGIVDTYIPLAHNVKCYDVNSLYPYAMFTFQLPVGQPTFISGDNIQLKDIFGFARVRVTAPLDLKCPTLPHKILIDGEFKSIYPVGI